MDLTDIYFPIAYVGFIVMVIIKICKDDKSS